MPNNESHVYDAEETSEEAAARRIDKAADLWFERNDLFSKTLRSNARHLSSYRRQMVLGWINRNTEQLQRELGEGEDIPRLNISAVPDDLYGV